MVYCCLVRQGDKYSPEYTRKLSKQLREVGYKPIILGDGDDADIPLLHGYQGWWAKLELFSPHMEVYRPFIYLDLDSLIIEPFEIECPTRLMVCKEWMGDLRGIQTSLMILPKYTSHIWHTIQTTKINFKDAHGDQGFLKQFSHNYIQDKYPDLISSYKVHSKIKPVSKIVTFHGNPKPDDPESGWAHKLWMNI